MLPFTVAALSVRKSQENSFYEEILETNFSYSQTFFKELINNIFFCQNPVLYALGNLHQWNLLILITSEPTLI